MISIQDFILSRNTFQFKSDKYDLSKIKSAKITANSLKSHILRIVCYGLLFSSIVWIVCPPGMGQILAPVALIVGLLFALVTSRRYELKVEFQHSDETGLQWITVAKTNKLSEKAILDSQVRDLLVHHGR
jgi:hypothetical protein